MEYEQFKEKIAEDVGNMLEAKGYGDVNIKFEITDKVNQTYESMVVTPEGSTVGASLKVDSMFDHYKVTGDYEAALNKAANTFERAIDNMPSYDTKAITEYDNVKDKLAIQLIPANKNENLLQKIPHKLIEDMAIVYRLILDKTEDGTSTVLVTNNLVQQFGITPEQLHEDAVENSPKIRPAELSTLRDTLVSMVGPEMAEFMDPEGPESKLYVATVDDKMNGAGVIAYPGFMEEVADTMGGDFYVIPCSVHEVIMVPDLPEMDIKNMEEMIHMVNSTELKPEDVLSEKLYHYDSQDKVFEMAEKFEKRQAIKESKAKEKPSVLGDLKAKRDELAKAPKPVKDEIEKAVKKTEPVI
ncbi:hypothetical protein SAMN02910298_02229 [Pseudobutyrivibrio sp. YE44]|uniref:DUF5688 family protein n=1 Tax=Pseudobutyrivibrio sp. YE44 TaxID=1520802 RepID=UPI00088FDBA2|nr:DUF5688 family protein [Pseudobutyrivibrio sp. YE44]SDB44903.1 hypothetical protein SAMN02910298_02229 [Pseudobutyrivibrio sp. YE44]